MPTSRESLIDAVAVVVSVGDRVAEHLSESLATHLGLAPSNGQLHMWTQPWTHTQFPVSQLGNVVVSTAEQVGPEQALEEFERLVAGKTVSVSHVMAYWGLHPLRSFELSDDFRIVPLGELPDDGPKSHLLGDDNVGGGFVVRARPRLALVHEMAFTAKLTDEDVLHWPDYHPVDKTEAMLDVGRLLTLGSEHPVIHIATWFSASDPLVPVGGWSGQAVGWGHQFLVPPTEMDEQRARLRLSQFQRLPKSDQQKLRVVLDRVNAAKGGPSPLESRAIDLGTAIEALLFDPKSDNNSEITFKFCTRGSILASALPSERRKVFRQLQRIYSLRSTAAHGGVFDTENNPPDEELQAGVRLAETLVQNVLERGAIPRSWNGEILGWEHAVIPDKSRLDDRGTSAALTTQVHGTRSVYENRSVNLDLVQITVPGGATFEHHVVRLQTVVMVVVLDENGRILMLWRHRFVSNQWGWELPGGIVEVGESVEDAGAREVEEETGWRPRNLRRVFDFQPMVGMVDTPHVVLFAEGATRVSEPSDAEEAGEVEWIPASYSIDLIRRNLVMGSGSVIGLLLALNGAD